MRICNRVILVLVVLVIGMGSSTEAGAVKRRWFKKVDGTGGADFAGGVAVAPDGHIYVTGSINAKNDNDNIWLRKYTTGGASVWTRKQDGPAGGEDGGYGVAVGPDGSIYVVGSVAVTGNWSDIWVREYSSAGDRMWTKKIQGDPVQPDAGTAVAVGPDGSVYAAGKLSVTGQGDDVWLRKYTPYGQKVWTRKYDEEGTGDEARSVTVAPDGNVYVCGSVSDSGLGRLFWLRKYSPAGKRKWTVTATEAYSCEAVAAAPNGAVYAVGTTKESGPFQEDGWLRKYSRKGKELWTETYDGGSNGEDRYYGVAVGPGGGVYATGVTEVTTTDHDILLVKYSSRGTYKWKRTYDHEGDSDEGRDIAVAPDGGIYITGYVFDQQTVPDIFLLKYK